MFSASGGNCTNWKQNGESETNTCIRENLLILLATVSYLYFRMLSSGIWRPAALVRRTNVSEEHITSIFRLTRFWVLPAQSEYIPHAGLRRQALATTPPQSCLSITVEVPLMGHILYYKLFWRLWKALTAVTQDQSLAISTGICSRERAPQFPFPVLIPSNNNNKRSVWIQVLLF
jgi:hypothetical protein